MPPKKKGRKGSKKSRASTAKKSVPDEHVPAFLILCQIDRIEHSINHYKKQKEKLRNEYRDLLTMFRRLESTKFSIISKSFLLIEELDGKKYQMELLEDSFRSEKEKVLRPAHPETQTMIQKLQGIIDVKNKDLDRLKEFGSIPDDTLAGELSKYVTHKEAFETKVGKEIEKLVSRHDSSIRNSATRTDRIINAVENKELDKMTDEQYLQEKENRRLRHAVEQLKKDEGLLMGLITQLEKKHTTLLYDSVQVDWNLRYESIPQFDSPEGRSEISLPSIKKEKDPIEYYSSEESVNKKLPKIGAFRSVTPQGQVPQTIIGYETTKREEDNKLSTVFGKSISFKRGGDMGSLKYYNRSVRCE